MGADTAFHIFYLRIIYCKFQGLDQRKPMPQQIKWINSPDSMQGGIQRSFTGDSNSWTTLNNAGIKTLLCKSALTHLECRGQAQRPENRTTGVWVQVCQLLCAVHFSASWKSTLSSGLSAARMQGSLKRGLREGDTDSRTSMQQAHVLSQLVSQFKRHHSPYNCRTPP